MSDPTARPARRLAAILGVSGVLHFAIPTPYRRIVPAPLKQWDAEIVAVSGAAELACAALLLLPPTRRLGGAASAALLAAVFPANVQMALDGGYDDAPFPANNRVAAWLRLPLQLPLLAMAVRVARGPHKRAVA